MTGMAGGCRMVCILRGVGAARNNMGAQQADKAQAATTRAALPAVASLFVSPDADHRVAGKGAPDSAEDRD